MAKLHRARARADASAPTIWLVAALVTTMIAMTALAPRAEARAAPESFADLVQKLLPSVVNISTTAVSGRGQGRQRVLPQIPEGLPFEDYFRDFFDRDRPQQPQRRSTSLGSGFIIDASGVIVTNHHVIEDADEITVTLHDNRTLKAEVVGRDPKTDLAVLKVESAQDLPAVPFGDSDAIRVGDWVVAIGNPFGLGGTVTAGIVSARGRDINTGPYDDFIQTDASINQGNSGGPLFNMAGEVVGINTAIFSPSGTSVGIGFSVPAAAAQPVIGQLRQYGRTRRGWLGVRIQPVTEEIAESLGMDRPSGALVASVKEGSPAEDGEIKAGDVILTFAGRDVDEMRKLPRIVAETEIDKAVPVQVWRDGKKVTTTVTVGELDEGNNEVAAADPAQDTGEIGDHPVAELGLVLSRINGAARRKFSLKNQARGVVVVGVEPNSAAAEKNLRAGDVIVEVSQDEVRLPEDVDRKIREAKDAGRKSLLLLVEGQSGLRFVALRIGES